MANIIDEVKGLYKIIEFDVFRKTEGVTFDIIPIQLFDKIDSMDRVLHEKSAVSPGPVGDVEKPWYMHPHQGDNLLVLHGQRHIDLYSVEHGKVEKFVVTNNEIYKNGELLVQGPAMLVWPPYVFHRIESKEEGSASLNFAYRDPDFNVDDNFSIYDVDIERGEFKVIREGRKDQFK